MNNQITKSIKKVNISLDNISELTNFNNNLVENGVKKICYFIEEKDGDFIKVGITNNIVNRSMAKTFSPRELILIGYIENEYFDTEQSLHSVFRKFHYRNEWFYKKEILNFINDSGNLVECKVKNKFSLVKNNKEFLPLNTLNKLLNSLECNYSRDGILIQLLIESISLPKEILLFKKNQLLKNNEILITSDSKKRSSFKKKS